MAGKKEGEKGGWGRELSRANLDEFAASEPTNM